MKSYLQRDRLRSIALKLASRFLLLVILSSFAGSFLPLATAEESTMPCCAGKAEGHCDSGLTAPKVPQPKPEPMCGLDAASSTTLNLDAVTTDVAEPVHTHKSASTSSSKSPAAESNTVEKQCQMDCGACTTATSRHKRESTIQTQTVLASPATVTVRFESTTSVHSSNEYWTQISPRGPPSRC
jgi:hypothetical protein